MFEDFTPKFKNVTKDKAGMEDLYAQLFRNAIVGCHRLICSFNLFDTLIFHGGEGNSRYS